MKKTHDKGTLWLYIVLVVSVLMVNPPILPVINDFCTVHPLTWGWPTLFLWLEFWYVVMIIDFLVAAIRLKAWDCSKYDPAIKPGKRPDLGR